MVGDQLAALQRLLPVVKGFTATEGAARAAQFGEAAVEANHREAIIVIKILPMRIAPQVDACKTVPWKIVVIGKFVALPQHGNSLARVECNRERLNTPEPAPIPRREPGGARSSSDNDRGAVVMRG